MLFSLRGDLTMSQWHAKNHWSNNYPWFIFNIDSHKLEQCPIYISIYQSKDLNPQTCTVWVITLLQIDELFLIQKMKFFSLIFSERIWRVGLIDYGSIPVSLQNQNFSSYHKIENIKWYYTHHIAKCFVHSFFTKLQMHHACTSTHRSS